jgi:hypothetical protein
MARLEKILATHTATVNAAVDQYLALYDQQEKPISRKTFAEFVNENGRKLSADIAGSAADSFHQSILANIAPVLIFSSTRSINFDAVGRWQKELVERFDQLDPEPETPEQHDNQPEA